MIRPQAAFAAALVAAFTASVSFADPIADQGRAVLEKNKNAVVTISVVVKQQFAAGRCRRTTNRKLN
jgi:hypothetical protein